MRCCLSQNPPIVIRLLHTSDWHLGRSLCGQNLLEDQAYALERLLELLSDRKPHALLIAGDIFDRSLPPEDAVTLLNQFLTRVIHEHQIPVFIIPGNHDSAERLGFASQLLRNHHLTIFSRVSDAFEPVLLKGDDGAEAWVYGIPFVEPILIGHALGNTELKTHDEAIAALCSSMLEKRRDTKPAVLLCHAFVMGGEESESEKEINIGGSSHVDARAFTGFSYTALGHLHKPQRAGAENIRYSGSLLAYSKSEVGHTKSITEIELSADGKTEIRTHELPCLRKLRYLEGEMDQILLEAHADENPNDYIMVGLTNSGAVFDAFSKLRAVYPNLLHVARVGGFSTSQLPRMKRVQQEEKTDLELFGDFFRESTGADLSSEERALVVGALEDLQRGDLL